LPAAPATLLAVASAVLLRVVAAAGQDDRDARVRALQRLSWEVRAVRLKGELRFDGRVDEPAWELAEPVVDFYQRERNEGLPATERTEVRVLFDAEHLYISAICYDSDPCTSTVQCNGAGACVAVSFTVSACNDNDPCTTPDTCNGAGACVGTPSASTDGLTCDDMMSSTTVDQCSGGYCVGM